MKEKFYTARGYEILDKEGLTASMEDYLEMICRLSMEKGYTRVKELSQALNVQAPSVTRMVQKLHEKDFLFYEPYGILRLSDSGRELGLYLLQRHQTLEDFFVMLGITKNVHKDVEGIEHNISHNTLQTILSLVDFFRDNTHILAQYHEYKNQQDRVGGS